MNTFSKHIVLCSQQFGNYWSGLGTYSTNLAKGLTDLGIKVTVVSPGDPGNIKGINFISVTPLKSDPTHGGWISLSYAYAKELSKLQADLIHFTDARESFAYRGNIPTIGTLHDDYFARHQWNPFYYKKDYVDWIKRWFYYSFVNLLERKALKRLSVLLANSNMTSKTISRAYEISTERINTVYLGMNVEIEPINKEIENYRLSQPKLLIVGGNIQRKGLPTLMEALRLLQEDYPDIKLQIVGKNQNIDKMKKMAKRLNIHDLTEFVGWVHPEKIQKYYKDASVFVMPSLMEGFGLVFLEAMAKGLPVIGGNVGGIPELIEDGKNGLLVTPRDPISLRNKIESLLKDKTLRRTLIHNGYDTIKEYSVTKMVNETITYYHQILNSDSYAK